jgi:hypothetical protein
VLAKKPQEPQEEEMRGRGQEPALARIRVRQEKGRITLQEILLFAWQNVPSERNQDQKDLPVPVWARLLGGAALVNPDGMTLCKNGEV